MARQQDPPDSENPSTSSIHRSASQRRRVQSEQAQQQPSAESSPVRHTRRRPPRTRRSQPSGTGHGSWGEPSQPVTPSPRQILKRSSRGQMFQGQLAARAGTESGMPGPATSSDLEIQPKVRADRELEDAPGSDLPARSSPSTPKSSTTTNAQAPKPPGQPTSHRGEGETTDTDRGAELSVVFAAPEFENREVSSDNDVDGNRRRSTKIAPDQAHGFQDGATDDANEGGQSRWKGPLELAVAIFPSLRRRSSAEAAGVSKEDNDDSNIKVDDAGNEKPSSPQPKEPTSLPASGKVEEEDESISSALYQNWLASGS